MWSAIADGRMPLAACRWPLADGRLPMAASVSPLADRVPVAACRWPCSGSFSVVPDCRSPLVGLRLPTGDRWSSLADGRLPVLDCQFLSTDRNLLCVSFPHSAFMYTIATHNCVHTLTNASSIPAAATGQRGVPRRQRRRL